MPHADRPTGSDLAAYMGRPDPAGAFDPLVATWVEYVEDVTADLPWTYAHTRAVLAQAAADVESVGYKGGVILSDFGPVYARRRTVQLEALLTRYGTGSFA